jgi:regulatory protein YycH of two-component signal transduction system YycFG
MNYEKIKSVILTILVVTSVFLTWNLWTYQPNYATMEHSNYVQEVALSEQRKMNDIITPNKIMYHFNDSHFGTVDSEDVNRTLEEIQTWNFYDFQNISDEIENLSDFIHSKGKVEIIFPDIIPMDIYKKIIHVEDEKMANFKFNRVVIDVESRTKGDGRIYFVNYGDSKSQQVYESHIEAADIRNYYNLVYSVADQGSPYYSYQMTDGRRIFLPENTIKMTSYIYFLDRLDTDKFKDALFDDPSYVQKNAVSNVMEYTDGSSMLTVNNGTLMLSYVNPAEETDIILNSTELLQNSIDFVNGHGGWTGNYKYEDMDEFNQQIIFRLYNRDGYPIFSKVGLSKITQVWGQKEIHKYTRPTFDLDVPLRTETTEVTLSSGTEIVEFLQTKKGLKQELLHDIVLGYSMTKDSEESQLISLKPSWFYKYDNSWVEITPEELGGIKRGLE